VELTFRTRAYRLRAPLLSAWGALERRELVEVELRDGDGRVGRGEAAPLEPYDGVPLPAVLAALDAYTAVMRVLPDHVPREDVLDACHAERPLPQALAAVDLALWDLEGKRAGHAAAHLIAAGAARSVPVNAVIAAADRAGAAEEAARATLRGFRCLKLKVGVGDDAGRLAAVRAAVGPDVALRVDANGAWRTADEALANLDKLAPAGIELCEEPVHGAEELAAVAERSPVAVAADESAGAVLEAGGGIDAVCLKVARCGGITGVLRDGARARDARMRVYVSSAFDGPAGIAGGLHAAAALAASGQVLACGLATLDALERAPRFPLRDGEMPLPDGDGLGEW